MLRDTNIVIYACQPGGEKIVKFLSERFYFCSHVNMLEALGYHLMKKQEREDLENFFEDCPLVTITREIVSIAIKIRQQKKLTLGDALIAASALHWGFPLFTNNAADFTGIENLQIIPLDSI